ncbi:hypothetical protein CVT25_009971 [Psilocybe cyanescens]|uniref:Uncharacterized protein n=1 Tax=Psilocybe cyanescens TaxID=93625 RepID=A0A409XCX5_PSICY|nr:hypothetical protein CVT25_009971 [Psilocybe cyanescens]
MLHGRDVQRTLQARRPLRKRLQRRLGERKPESLQRPALALQHRVLRWPHLRHRHRPLSLHLAAVRQHPVERDILQKKALEAGTAREREHRERDPAHMREPDVDKRVRAKRGAQLAPHDAGKKMPGHGPNIDLFPYPRNASAAADDAAASASPQVDAPQMPKQGQADLQDVGEPTQVLVLHSMADHDRELLHIRGDSGTGKKKLAESVWWIGLGREQDVAEIEQYSCEKVPLSTVYPATTGQRACPERWNVVLEVAQNVLFQLNWQCFAGHDGQELGRDQWQARNAEYPRKSNSQML